MYLGTDNPDGITPPAVADRSFYISKTLLVDACLRNGSMLPYRLENAAAAAPLMVGDRSELYAATIRMTTGVANKFTVMREPMFKRAKIAKI